MANSMQSRIRLGASCCVHLRLERGELASSIGIEGGAEVRTESPEFCEIERNSDGSTTCPAHLIFALLGSSPPVFIPAGQLVTILHDGLDLTALDGAVPALCYAPSRSSVSDA